MNLNKIIDTVKTTIENEKYVGLFKEVFPFIDTLNASFKTFKRYDVFQPSDKKSRKFSHEHYFIFLGEKDNNCYFGVLSFNDYYYISNTGTKYFIDRKMPFYLENTIIINNLYVTSKNKTLVTIYNKFSKVKQFQYFKSLVKSNIKLKNLNITKS